LSRFSSLSCFPASGLSATLAPLNPMAARLFNLMLCALLLGLSSPAAKAITRPENRVGGLRFFRPILLSRKAQIPLRHQKRGQPIERILVKGRGFFSRIF
jgi:hypothetical protein